MHYFLALFIGVLVSIMVAINGALSGVYGVHAASVFIHLVGFSIITLILLAKRESPFSRGLPWYLYAGGAIGVMTVLFTNVPFGRISVSAILALGLFGQGVFGLMVDHFAWLGMPRHAFHKKKFVGLILILAGIVAMITSFDLLAVLLSFLSGVSVIVSRTLNARLAELRNIRISTFFNYCIGLSLALCIYLLFGRAELGFIPVFHFSSVWFLYVGGAIGAFVIALTNVLVVKISAFYLSLLLFVGQVATAMAIDVLLSGAFSMPILIGGILVTLGLVVDLFLDRKPANAHAQ